MIRTIGTLTNTIPVHVSDPDDTEGLALLEKAVAVVKKAGITEKFMWNVGDVRDLKSLPKQHAKCRLLGLNYNSGEIIYVRLRGVRSSVLFPFSKVLGTLIHELVHCACSAHDSSFYELESRLKGMISGLSHKTGPRKLESKRPLARPSKSKTTTSPSPRGGSIKFAKGRGRKLGGSKVEYSARRKEFDERKKEMRRNILAKAAERRMGG